MMGSDNHICSLLIVLKNCQVLAVQMLRSPLILGQTHGNYEKTLSPQSDLIIASLQISMQWPYSILYLDQSAAFISTLRQSLPLFPFDGVRELD